MNTKDRTYFNKSPINKDDLAKVKAAIAILEQDPQAYDFIEPVDYIGLGLTDYPDIIKNMMDIGTVKSKIQSAKYNTIQDILNDIQLIWDNCRTYNMAGSDIYKMANHCEKVFKRALDKQFRTQASTVKPTSSKEKTETRTDYAAVNQYDEGGHDEILSYNEKVNVTEKIRKLSTGGLNSLVKLVQKECPQAFEDLDSEKVQIKVELFDRRTYDHLNSLIDSLIGHGDSPATNKKMKV